MTLEEKAVYEKTVKRLHRLGKTDPTSQIIALANEIEHYRRDIDNLIQKYEALQNAKSEPSQAEPIPVAEDNRHEPADIVMVPQCKACGAILEDVAAIVSYTTYGETGYTSCSHRIKPDRCPKCGRWFKAIQQKIIQPEVEEERQP